MSWLSLVLTAATAGGLLLARRRLLVVTVTGSSMTPTYHPGDRVLVLRTRRLRRGRVAVSRLPLSEDLGGPGDAAARLPTAHRPPRPQAAHAARQTTPLIIKRVAAVPGDAVPPAVRPAVADTTVPAGKLVLIGDGRLSADSRLWGLYSIEDVVGVVVAQLHRASTQQPTPVERHPPPARQMPAGCVLPHPDRYAGAAANEPEGDR